MSEQCTDTLRCRPEDLQQAMSVHTRKITDSCRDKDCIEDLRVFLTTSSQALLDSCANARVRCAELLYTYIDVEPASFDDKHYCIDVTFYYRILADAVVGAGRPATLYGLAVFSKRAVLCGEDRRTHLFRSDSTLSPEFSQWKANRPTAVVEVLDPMVLASRVKDVCDCSCQESCILSIPSGIQNQFDEELVLSGDRRRLFVTLGQFSIIRLERDAQIIVPILDYSLPTKDCCDAVCGTEDPCELFSRIPFPTRQFTPKDCDADNDSQGYQTTKS